MDEKDRLLLLGLLIHKKYMKECGISDFDMYSNKCPFPPIFFNSFMCVRTCHKIFNGYQIPNYECPCNVLPESYINKRIMAVFPELYIFDRKRVIIPYESAKLLRKMDDG